jgi:hypothetical protein
MKSSGHAPFLGTAAFRMESALLARGGRKPRGKLLLGVRPPFAVEEPWEGGIITCGAGGGRERLLVRGRDVEEGRGAV